MSELLKEAEIIARAAGAEAMKYYNHIRANTVVHKGNAKDLVSTADKAVESLITKMIHERFPDHAVFGEEYGRSMENSRYCWVVDPIDGTLSFVRNQPYFSVSIAVKKDGEPVAGCVFAPRLDLIFTAEKGQGAFENGQPIHAAECTDMAEAVCGTGFACLRAGLKENNMPICDRIFPVVRDIKRCGSAAIDLCFVASGRYDAFWEIALQEYDVAAGALIASEAGAQVCDMTGGEDYPFRGILCTNQALQGQFLPYFNVVKL